MSKHLFENITDDEAAALEWVLHNSGSCAADYFFDDPTVDGRMEELIKLALIKEEDSGGLSITELGRAALKEHQLIVEKRLYAEQQRNDELSSLKSISASAIKEVNFLKEQMELIKEQAESSDKDSRFSKTISIISTIISFASVIIAVIALLESF